MWWGDLRLVKISGVFPPFLFFFKTSIIKHYEKDRANLKDKGGRAVKENYLYTSWRSELKGGGVPSQWPCWCSLEQHDQRCCSVAESTSMNVTPRNTVAKGERRLWTKSLRNRFKKGLPAIQQLAEQVCVMDTFSVSHLVLRTLSKHTCNCRKTCKRWSNYSDTTKELNVLNAAVCECAGPEIISSDAVKDQRGAKMLPTLTCSILGNFRVRIFSYLNRVAAFFLARHAWKKKKYLDSDYGTR